MLKESITCGITQNRHGRICNKAFAQGLPAQDITGGIQYQSAEGRGNVKPVLDQQCGAQYAAFCHVGQGVDIVNAEGLKNTGKHDDDTVG